TASIPSATKRRAGAAASLSVRAIRLGNGPRPIDGRWAGVVAAVVDARRRVTVVIVAAGRLFGRCIVCITVREIRLRVVHGAHLDESLSNAATEIGFRRAKRRTPSASTWKGSSLSTANESGPVPCREGPPVRVSACSCALPLQCSRLPADKSAEGAGKEENAGVSHTLMRIRTGASFRQASNRSSSGG